MTRSDIVATVREAALPVSNGMRLLIVTQVVDENDLYLSFFTGWLRALSSRFERIEVICLKEGKHSLPKNVHVHSLGKEKGVGRVRYVLRFYRYLWSLRNEYDAVYVHMNQEYVLLGGVLLAMLGKPLYLWRNHYAGTFWTDVAAMFCKKVFYTSKSSYTAKFKHAVRMPVGVDIERFAHTSTTRIPRSILFFARFAPSKRPDVFVKALSLLQQRGVAFTASIVGSALPQDEKYSERVGIQARDHGLTGVLTFAPGVPNAQAPAVYAAHDIFVDLGSSGMYNKMIFEAAASGCLVLAASRDFQDEMGEEFGFPDDEASELSAKLEKVLSQSGGERTSIQEKLHAYTLRNSLETLAETLKSELKKS